MKLSHRLARRLAARFQHMAYVDDGLIEAFYDPKADFIAGLQFHPERMNTQRIVKAK